MDIALVSHVKDQTVPAGVVETVDRHCQLHRPQVGRQMSAGAGHALHQKLTQLAAQQLQFPAIQFFHIRWGRDLFQNQGIPPI